MKILLAIALGGAIGSLGRYLVTSGIGRWIGHGFPYGTLTVNVLGSFAMGVLIEYMAQNWSPSPEIRAFLVVGILGAFTTFSTFSLDTVTLYERGALIPMAGYMIASVVLSVIGLLGGLALMRSVLA